MPKYNIESIVTALEQAWDLIVKKEELHNIRQNALATVVKYSLTTERSALLAVIDQLDTLWAKKELFIHES
jgi:hypothetical protein